MRARELLIDTYPHIPPVRTVEGLDASEAERHTPHVTHLIAEIVAHVAFWQDWFCRRCNGIAEPMAASAASGWPVVAEGSWPRVQEQFLMGLGTIGRDRRPHGRRRRHRAGHRVFTTRALLDP